MSASSKARQRRTQRELERKRQQQIYLIVGVVVVAVVALAVVILIGRPVEAPVGAEIGQEYSGIERGLSPEGMPQLGSPDAPVTIHEYSAFTCSHCLSFHDNQFRDLLNNEIRSGQVRFVFVPVVFGDVAIPANRAAFCALDQDYFWEMHDILFGWQALYGALYAFNDTRSIEGARQLGLDQAAFTECLNSEQTQRRVDTANSLFTILVSRYAEGEVTGTPTLTFNGEAVEYTAGSRSGGWPIQFIRDQIAALTRADG